MDALDRVATAGRDLLRRVDAALKATGAPAGDPLWPLLRSVGALPGDAFEFALGLDPEPLLAAAAELRVNAERYAERQTELAEHLGDRAWQGSGAEAFAAVWRALGAHIGDARAADEPSLTGRLLAVASYLDSVAAWASELRIEVALAVMAGLGSAEAVALRSGAPLTVGNLFDNVAGPAVAQAASTIGARVLGVVADRLRAGHDLHDEWAPWLAELPYRSPADTGGAGFSPVTRVEL